METSGADKPVQLGRVRIRLGTSSAVASFQRTTVERQANLTPETPDDGGAIEQRWRAAIQTIEKETSDAEIVAVASSAFIEAGLNVEEMPDGDAVLSVSWDLKTGITVTTTSSIAGGKATPERLQRDIAKSLMAAVRRVMSGSMEKLRAASLGDDVDAFVAAFPDRRTEEDTSDLEAVVKSGAGKWPSKAKIIFALGSHTAFNHGDGLLARALADAGLTPRPVDAIPQI